MWPTPYFYIYACALLLSSLLSLATSLCQLDVVCKRAGNEQGRVGTYDNTHQQCEYEALNALTAKAEDSEQHDEGRHRGRERTAQGVVQCVVDILSTVVLRIQGIVLTDTVEDDHGIVDRVTDNGQDSSDERLVNFHRERHDLPQDSIQTQ